LSTEANKTLPIDAHFAELRLVAPGQGEAPDEPADETPVRLLGDRRVDDQRVRTNRLAPVSPRRRS
jgi:hypothetical protein